MEIKIDMKKRHLWILSSLLVIAVVIGFGGEDPDEVGHTGGEILINDAGTDIKLQDLINQDLINRTELDSDLTTLHDSIMTEAASLMPQAVLEEINFTLHLDHIGTRYCAIPYGDIWDAFMWGGTGGPDVAVENCNNYLFGRTSNDDARIRLLSFFHNVKRDNNCFKVEWKLHPANGYVFGAAISGGPGVGDFSCWQCDSATGRMTLLCYKWPY